MEYKKLSNTEIERTEVVTRKIVMTLEQLEAERDGLIKTKVNLQADFDKKNLEIDTILKQVNEMILEAQKLGVVKPVKEEIIAEELVEEVTK